tara:strand:- start:309 stop:548 length:240 start_codon:yes stop_codon:yes gene_type:complete
VVVFQDKVVCPFLLEEMQVQVVLVVGVVIVQDNLRITEVQEILLQLVHLKEIMVAMVEVILLILLQEMITLDQVEVEVL